MAIPTKIDGMKPKDFVQKIYDEGHYDLTTKGGSGDFTRDVAVRLYELDDNFGELLKSSGRTHVVDSLGRRVAVDAVLYKETGQSIDIIGSSASPKAKPAWTIDKPRYDDDDWAKPAGAGVSGPDPDPIPPVKDEDIIRLEEKIATLEVALQTNKDLMLAILEGFEGRINELLTSIYDRLDKLETQKLTLRASGSTSRSWGHAHDVDIILEQA